MKTKIIYPEGWRNQDPDMTRPKDHPRGIPHQADGNRATRLWAVTVMHKGYNDEELRAKFEASAWGHKLNDNGLQVIKHLIDGLNRLNPPYNKVNTELIKALGDLFLFFNDIEMSEWCTEDILAALHDKAGEYSVTKEFDKYINEA